MRIKVAAMVAVTLFLLGMAGCAKYYQVRDPQNGGLYYTSEISDKSGGAIRFEDAGTGSIVTLQNSEVKKISKSEFNEGIEKRTDQAKPQAVQPAQVAAPAPVDTPPSAQAPMTAPTAPPPPDVPALAPSEPPPAPTP